VSALQGRRLRLLYPYSEHHLHALLARNRIALPGSADPMSNEAMVAVLERLFRIVDGETLGGQKGRPVLTAQLTDGPDDGCLEVAWGGAYWEEMEQDRRELIAMIVAALSASGAGVGRQQVKALIAKWREEARLARPLESQPLTAEKRARMEQWIWYTNRANELEALLGSAEGGGGSHE
jgi:hypothetical protein